jgi:ubiquitin
VLEMEELGGYTRPMLSTRALAVAVALACGALPRAASAQWQWVDKDGRKVFSDKAPPPEVPAKNIVRQPGMRAPVAAADTPAVAASAAPAKTAAASAPKLTGKDSALEEKRKQAAVAEQEKKKAQERENAEGGAENCKRAREAKATIDSGVRLARVNDKGEREIMDDAARSAEVQRLQAVITRDCKPAQ